MISRIPAILLFGSLISLGLAACSENGAPWDNYAETRHNRVELLRIPHDVHFTGSMADLTPQESVRLDRFLATMKPGSADVIALDLPAAQSGVAAKRAEAVRSHLQKAGYKVAPDSAATGEAPAPGSVRLVLERAVVRTPDCPDWSRRAHPNYNNAPTSNSGCATETALGLMIANPRDLVAPADYQPASADNDARAIENLRNGKVEWSTKQGQGSTMTATK